MTRRNRRRKVTQKITEDKQSASSQLVLKVSKSLHQRLKSQPKWTNLVIEAITEKLAKLENNSQFLNTEAVFQMVLEATPMPIMISRISDEKIVYANPITNELLGLSAQELLQNYSIRDLWVDASQIQDLLDTITQEKTITNNQYCWQKPDNSIIWVSVSAQLFEYQEETSILTAWCEITQLKEIEQTLAETQSFLQLVLDNIPQLIFWKDRNSLFLGCNRLWAEAAGLSDLEQVKGKTDEEIYQYPNNRHKHPPIEILSYYREQDRRVITTGQPELHFIEQRLNPDGEEVWYDTNKIPIKDSEGQIVGILGTIENITSRTLIERTLFQEKELAQVTLQSIAEGVITTDASGQIQDCNPAAENLLGWTKLEIQGRPASQVLRLLDELTRQPVDNPIDRVLEQAQVIRLENTIILLSQDQTEYAVDITASPIRSFQGELMGVVLVISDHTQSRQLARQLSWQANHDPLTQLVNRQMFEKRVEEALKDSKNYQTTHTLGYLDLDQFKIINDTCGHVAGDELLRQISFLFQQRIRASDTIARLGGDEFGLLLLNCPIQEGEKIAETFRQLVENFRFTWEQQTFSIGVSIGLVPIHPESTDVTTLLDTADTACYSAKSKGRNRIEIFRTDERALNKQRQARQWVLRLNQALEESRFRLYTQKIVPLTSETATNIYEVLLRLFDEQGNIIMPGNFISVAERYQLMPIIDRWVVESFLNQYAQYYQTNSLPISREDNKVFSINLSPVSLNNDEFINFLRQQLSRPDIRPQCICFEIAESTAIANLSQVKQVIDHLKPLGCRFALDHVGTGINSLSYLKTLSLDYLKINGNLIQNMLIDPVDYTFVECFNRIGHALGMQTVAEFVEDTASLEALRRIGVDYGQGYAIARPVPLLFNSDYD